MLHLGNGSSMCAIAGGRSVASTMGFTAADGLPMGTRCGNLDPGVVLYLMDELGMDARAIEKLIYQQSGLLGVSGDVERHARRCGQRPSRARELAIDLFVYRIGRELGSLAAALGGLDAIVFTGGHRREQPLACASASAATPHGSASSSMPRPTTRGGPRISTAASRVSAWVIPTNEELMIARHTLQRAGCGRKGAR